MLRIASTVCPVEPWISLICALISSVAFAVWLASDLTSLATTANPLPASPARAASIVALSASRLVRHYQRTWWSDEVPGRSRASIDD
jgi:hypothetical protein